MVRGRGRSTATSATIRPGRGDMTTTRSATRIASGMLWVTITIVVAARSHSRSSSRSKRSRVSASRALNGSSRSSTSGSSASARARATRWLVPPDSSPGRDAATAGSRPTRSRQDCQPFGPPLEGPAGKLERVGDVVGGGSPRQEPWLLEDEPDPRVRAVRSGRRRAVPRRRPARAGRRSRAGAWTCHSRWVRSVRRSRPSGIARSIPSRTGNGPPDTGRKCEVESSGSSRPPWVATASTIGARGGHEPLPSSRRRIGAVAG